MESEIDKLTAKGDALTIEEYVRSEISDTPACYNLVAYMHSRVLRWHYASAALTVLQLFQISHAFSDHEGVACDIVSQGVIRRVAAGFNLAHLNLTTWV